MPFLALPYLDCRVLWRLRQFIKHNETFWIYRHAPLLW